jgi:hypothetical protein
VTRPLRNAIRTLNHIVRPVDELLAPDPWSDSPPLFLVGSARSGTTLAYQVLAQAFHTTYLPRAVNLVPGLTHACFRLFSRRLRKAPASLRSEQGRTPGLFGPSEAIGFWTPWVNEQGPRTEGSTRKKATLESAVHRLQGHLEAPLLVKCLYLVQSLEFLAGALPNARFVHVTRAPVPTIASIFRTRLKTTQAWWSVRPTGADRVSSLSLLDQCVWQHFTVDAIVRDVLSRLSHDRSRILAYEKLCRDPGNEVERLRHWLTPLGWMGREDWNPPSLVPSDRVDAELERKIRESPEFQDA